MANNNQKRAGMAKLISDKIGFKTKIVTTDKRPFTLIFFKKSIYQDITIVNIHAPDNRTQNT